MSYDVSRARFYYGSTLAFIAAAVAVVLLDTPVLREVFGTVFVGALPGILLLLSLRLNHLGLAEKMVLAVGLNTAFLMLFGWLLSEVSLEVGYERPLSTGAVVPALAVAMAVLATIAYRSNREAFEGFPFHARLNVRSKLVLLVPACLPLLAVLGMRSFHTSGSNHMLLATLLLVPVCLILLIVLRRGISTDCYPLAIIGISFALLGMFWLRSEHLIGMDVHEEYYTFSATAERAQWSILHGSVLDSCLSISVLPAVIQSVLDVSAGEYLFKGVYVFVCAFTPVAVYVIARKYLTDAYALLAAVFFASQEAFLAAPGSPRTNVALLFFALLILTLFHSRVGGARRRLLLIIVFAGLVVSHYSSTYIAFGLVTLAYVVVHLLRRYVPAGMIPGAAIVLFAVMIFFWNGQWTETPFVEGVAFIEDAARGITQFGAQNARDPMVAKAVGTDIAGGGWGWANWGLNWIVLGCTGLGVVLALARSRISRRTGDAEGVAAVEPIDTEYVAMAAGGIAIMAATVIVPHLSQKYDMERAYAQVAILLGVFFVMGGMMLSVWSRLGPSFLLLFVVIPYFLFSTGAITTMYSDDPHWMLSNEAESVRYGLVRNEETKAAEWLAERRSHDIAIRVVDRYGAQRLVSQGTIPPNDISFVRFLSDDPRTDGYVFLDYVNVSYDEAIVQGEIVAITGLDEHLRTKKRIYANGGSELWE